MNWYFFHHSSHDKLRDSGNLFSASSFLSCTVHRDAGCCCIAAPSRTSLTKLLFPLRHRSEPRLFSSFPAQNNVYQLKTIPNQNGNGNDNYGYEHEVCVSVTASPPLRVCLVYTNLKKKTKWFFLINYFNISGGQLLWARQQEKPDSGTREENKIIFKVCL